MTMLLFDVGNVIVEADHKITYRILQDYGTPIEYQQVKDAHDSHLYGIDRAVVAILDRIPKSQLAFATNTNDWQTERERQLIGLTLYSDKIFRSNDIQMLKTDDACFPYIINQLQVESGQIT